MNLIGEPRDEVDEMKKQTNKKTFQRDGPIVGC